MKLTECDKKSIVDRTISKSFNVRQDSLNYREDALARKLYDMVYTPDIIQKMNALPDHFFNRSKRIFLTNNINTQTYVLEFLEPRKVAASDMYWDSPIFIDVNNIYNDLFVEAKKIQDLNLAIREDTKTAKRKLSGFLSGITTWKRLEDAWPEGKEYYKFEAPCKPLINPPMVTGKEVQDLLNKLSEAKHEST
jgi:hypothetical protein